MSNGYYPIQLTLPIAESTIDGADIQLSSPPTPSDLSSFELLEHKDPTLMFMTLAVTMTKRYEMPIVRAYTGTLPSDIRGLHRVSNSGLRNVAPHFYFDDSHILRYWNKPFETAQMLARFECSIGMDFSMTNEMPRPQKIHASYLNKLWVAWLQSRGHAVIPNVSFPDEWQQDYWIDGWPKHSVIAVSSVGVLTHGNSEGWLKAVEKIRRELQPVHILRYGPRILGESNENCTYFANDNHRAANGWK